MDHPRSVAGALNQTRQAIRAVGFGAWKKFLAGVSAALGGWVLAWLALVASAEVTIPGWVVLASGLVLLSLVGIMLLFAVELWGLVRPTTKVIGRIDSLREELGSLPPGQEASVGAANVYGDILGEAVADGFVRGPLDHLPSPSPEAGREFVAETNRELCIGLADLRKLVKHRRVVAESRDGHGFARA